MAADDSIIGGVNLPSCLPYSEVGVLLLHLADSAFNESECSARCQENNPEELEGTARLMFCVRVSGPWENPIDSAAH